MLDDTSNHELLIAWKSGDQDAAGLLFRRYQARLMALVRSRLSRKLVRRVDAEDIVLSAYRSFFVAVRDGRAVPAADDDLWPLLTTIVLRKLARQSRRHAADRRSIDQEQQGDSDWMEYVGSHEPDAEQAAVLADEVERLLAMLDATAREVLVRTLQGDDVITIATALGINERTVRRALERIRQELPVDGTEVHGRRGPVTAKRTSPRKSNRSAQGTTTYDQYLLQQFIGAGAFSKVYRAIDRSSGETVAVKFLRRDCWNDDRAMGSLIREYEILKRLQHPNILSMRDWGTTPRGALFLVTDYIPGVNLADWRLARQPSVAQIVEIAWCVATAVAVAHAGGVLHCDLKPANVLMRDDGQIVLCDFGLARHVMDPDDVPRGGTAGFLSPEQISDAFGSVTEKSDVYGLGGLLYALLTGSPPMSGQDLPEILSNVLSSASPQSPSRLGAQSSPELDAIALRCLQKEPSRRFDTASDVATALRNQTSGVGSFKVQFSPSTDLAISNDSPGEN